MSRHFARYPCSLRPSRSGAWTARPGPVLRRRLVRGAMMDDEALREKLAKVEALFRRARSPGEQAAAGAAMDRLHDRFGALDRDGGLETELRFSLPDGWSVRLFVAICRKHGLRPFRYGRQRRTTIMVRARERHFDRHCIAHHGRR